MSNRHLARTLAMQSLYQWDFLNRDTEDLPEIVKNVFEEFAKDFNDDGFVDALIRGVVNNQKEIDGRLGL